MNGHGAQRLPDGVQVVAGENHLDLSQPGMGNVVTVYSPSTQRVHLFGNFTADAVKFMGDNLSDEESIHRALVKTADDRDFLDHLSSNFDGYNHKHIRFEAQVPDGIVIGGGAAYYDGQKLYLGDYSTDFGPMTEQSLLLVGAASSTELSLGRGVNTGDAYFCEKGIARISRALKEG